MKTKKSFINEAETNCSLRLDFIVRSLEYSITVGMEKAMETNNNVIYLGRSCCEVANTLEDFRREPFTLWPNVYVNTKYVPIIINMLEESGFELQVKRNTLKIIF